MIYEEEKSPQEEQIKIEKIELTDEESQDFKRSLIERIKALIKSVFHTENGKPLHGKELDDYLISSGQSEEEKQLIKKMIEETDDFYRKKADLKKSGKDVDEWYEDEITRIAKESNSEDVDGTADVIKSVIATQSDIEIEQTMQEIDNLIDEEGSHEV